MTLTHTLDTDTLFALFSHSLPEDIYRMMMAGDKLLEKKVLGDGGYESPGARWRMLWRDKMQRHFPDRFLQAIAINEKAGAEAEINWADEFSKAYKVEYKGLRKYDQYLFSLIKEGCISGLKTKTQRAWIYKLDLIDVNGVKLQQWAVKTGDQRLLDYLYSCVGEKYTETSLTIDVAGRLLGGFTILHWAVYFNQSKVIIDGLISGGADVNAACINGATALYIAAQNGHLDVVKELISKSVNVNAACSNGATALHIAAHQGHLDVVKALISKGADVNAGSADDGATALHLAVQQGHLDVVKALISKGADVNAGSVDGTTALHIAAQNGHLDVVKALISKGADVNAGSVDGTTALHIAAQKGHLDVVKELLSKGVDVNAACSDGAMALHIAAQQGHVEIAQAINQQCLLNYLKELALRPDNHYKTSYQFFGETINFGFSAKEKSDAAKALKAVMIDGGDISLLADHQGALKNKDLGKIYQTYCQYRPSAVTADPHNAGHGPKPKK